MSYFQNVPNGNPPKGSKKMCDFGPCGYFSIIVSVDVITQGL